MKRSQLRLHGSSARSPRASRSSDGVEQWAAGADDTSMRSLWGRRRIRAYAYSALLLLSVFVAEIVYVGAQLARASSNEAQIAPPPRVDERPLPRIPGPGAQSRIDPNLTRAARDLGATGAEVRCWSARDWAPPARDALGYTYGQQVHLPARACNALVTFKAGPELWWPSSEHLLLLAHELQHARGISDEEIAECYGLQSVELLARELGADKQLAKVIARMALAWYKDNRPEYKSPECRNGGALDFRPDSTDWP